MYFDKHADPSLILGRRVAVLGYGAQGRAQALNLHDSGVEVVVGLRNSSRSRERAQSDGLRVADIETAVSEADVVAMLVPDEAQAEVYERAVADRLRPGAAMIFAHGFNIHYGRIEPREDVDVLMVAPLGIGEQVRQTYRAGAGVPALLAVHQDATGESRELGLSYAWANGHGRAGVIMTSFAEETETDLFAEQVVLCGGLTHLIGAAFDTLVDAGYSPEIAYFCCFHEVKLIADLVYQRGIAGMRESISTTAEFGDYTRGPRVIDEHVREQMREILDEIRSGSFALELSAEIAAGGPILEQGRERASRHASEAVGGRLRATMAWLARGDDEDTTDS